MGNWRCLDQSCGRSCPRRGFLSLQSRGEIGWLFRYTEREREQWMKKGGEEERRESERPHRIVRSMRVWFWEREIRPSPSLSLSRTFPFLRLVGVWGWSVSLTREREREREKKTLSLARLFTLSALFFVSFPPKAHLQILLDFGEDSEMPERRRVLRRRSSSRARASETERERESKREAKRQKFLFLILRREIGVVCDRARARARFSFSSSSFSSSSSSLSLSPNCFKRSRSRDSRDSLTDELGKFSFFFFFFGFPKRAHRGRGVSKNTF